MLDASSCLAVIGDVHSAWSRDDVQYFNRSAYPLLLVTGDLGGSEARDGLSVARHMAELTRRTLVMPGNNDVGEYARIAAELTYRQGRGALLRDPDDERSANEGVRTCGYSSHALHIAGRELTIIAARPFSMGGPEVSFPDALERSFGVRTLEHSTERLCALVDEAQSERLIFFAHNGPYGLGSSADDPWGRDFHPDAGDWGDRDLRVAIERAGSRTLGVVGGHMHWRLKIGGKRSWQRREGGVLYVNAARVPRIERARQGAVHSHIALELAGDQLVAHEVEVLLEND